MSLVDHRALEQGLVNSSYSPIVQIRKHWLGSELASGHMVSHRQTTVSTQLSNSKATDILLAVKKNIQKFL